jgi:hypothetical protein
MLAKHADEREFWRQRAAFHSVKVLHPDVWRQTLASDLTRLYRVLADDDALLNGCRVLFADDELWTYLDEGQQTRLKAYVRDLPQDHVFFIDEFLDYAPLKANAEVRVAKMDFKDFNISLWFVMPRPVGDRLVQMYAASGSFDEANRWGKLVQQHATDLSKVQVKQIIEAAGKNGEIRGSFQLRPVLQAFRRTKYFADALFDEMLTEHGLNEFVADA